MFETALRNRVRTALPGSHVEWDMRPQASSYPAVVIELIAGERAQTFGGVQHMQRDRIQFSIFAMSKPVAVNIREALIALLTTPASVDDTEFQRGEIVLYRSDVEDTENGPVRIEIVDAYLWHSTP